MKIDSLKDVLIHELNDLYSAEDQLIEALPQMAQAASTAELQSCRTRSSSTWMRRAITRSGSSISSESSVNGAPASSAKG